jgi:FkbH-like protein
VVIFWELANLVDGLQYKAELFDQEKMDSLIQKTKSEIDYVFTTLSKTSYVLINKFSTLLFNYSRIEKNNYDYIADELNKYLAEVKPKNVSLIELDKIIASTSVEESIDRRFYYSSKALYSIEFFKSWSKFVLPIIRSLNGKAKKAIIFDCDNTLWGGILGEEGAQNILLSSKQKGGTPFEEVQTIAKSLNKEGIIIGICSKNNLTDVESVLKNHDGMTLKSEDFSIKKINWDDKVSNLQSIAKTLNIGTDSLVFVDDSDFEVNFVKERLPEITIIKVPEKTVDYPKVIRENLGLFFNVSKTDEDAERIKMYKEQIQREEIKSVYSNLEEYIKSLEIQIQVHVNDNAIVPRMAQMTQKTNQFNLTTKRYSEGDIQNFINKEDATVFAISVADKFGDNGITGLCIVKHNDGIARVDSFLLSCRIIGRSIEFKFIDYVVSQLKKRGTKTIYSEYLKTLKNEQVVNFYDSMGFEIIEKGDEKTTYKMELNDFKSKQLDFIEISNG